MGLPGSTVVKNLTHAGDSGDVGSIFQLERSPRVRNGNPLQYSCLENSMDRITWQTIAYRVAESGRPLQIPCP